MPTRPLVTSYEDDQRLFADRWSQLGLLIWVVALIAFPIVANDHWMSIAQNAAIAVVGSVAMMVLTGFAGQVSLGHAAFLAVGAYAAAILGTQLGLPFWLVIIASGALAAMVGLTVGPFALRLEGLYLAIVTVGLLFVVEHLLRNGLDLAFGKDYLTVPMHGWFAPPGEASLGSFRQDGVVSASYKLYLLFVGLAVGSVWIGKNIQRSNIGRAMMAVRDRDLAAAALGVHRGKTKLIAFGVSSFLAGVAGAMYAFAHPVITLEPFSLKMSVQYVAMVVLGGVGTTFGAVAGALAYTVVLPLAESLGALLPFPPGFSSEHQGVLIFFPLMCAFLIVEPLGLLGVWLRIKRYFQSWPFSY